MAKKTITQSTVATNNIQSQPDQVKSQAAALKLAFDQYGIDSKTYNNNTLLVELADESVGNSGSNTIGHNSTTVTADNVGDALEENAQAISGAILGQIPDNTLTEAKMAAEMKKQAGGVAKYNDLEGLRIAELDTGVADAYVVTTVGPFVRTDGNTLPFIPANNNTGASTINEDTNGVAPIQKYVDGAWVAIEEGDLKKFQQVSLVWNTSESAFQLAPKGGALIKGTPQDGEVALTVVSLDVDIVDVDINKSIVEISNTSVSVNISDSKVSAQLVDVGGGDIKVRLQGDSGVNATVYWKVTEYVNSEVQRGSASTESGNVAISALDDYTKARAIAYLRGNSGGVDDFTQKFKLTSNTNLNLATAVAGVNTPVTEWQVVQHK